VWTPPTSMDFFVNGLLLMSLVLGTFFLFGRAVRSHDLFVPLFLFSAALYSAYLLIFTVAHFEVRYFNFPKISGLVMLMVTSAIHFRNDGRMRKPN